MQVQVEHGENLLKISPGTCARGRCVDSVLSVVSRSVTHSFSHSPGVSKSDGCLMKRFYVPMTVLLLGSLACGVISSEMPGPTQTISPPVAGSSTSLPTDEPVASQAFDEKATTEPPSPPAPVASPQPAVARHRPGDAIVLDRITMIDAQNGWAISGGDVLFTTDGARTWREVTPPETLPPESQVQAQGVFLDARHAWIIFSIDQQIPVNTVVWRTEDGGHTWTVSAALEHQVFGEQVWAEGFALDADHIWLLVRGVY